MDNMSSDQMPENQRQEVLDILMEYSDKAPEFISGTNLANLRISLWKHVDGWYMIVAQHIERARIPKVYPALNLVQVQTILSGLRMVDDWL